MDPSVALDLKYLTIGWVLVSVIWVFKRRQKSNQKRFKFCGWQIFLSSSSTSTSSPLNSPATSTRRSTSTQNDVIATFSSVIVDRWSAFFNSAAWKVFGLKLFGFRFRDLCNDEWSTPTHLSYPVWYPISFQIGGGCYRAIVWFQLTSSTRGVSAVSSTLGSILTLCEQHHSFLFKNYLYEVDGDTGQSIFVNQDL